MMIAEINENGKNEWNDERTTQYIIDTHASNDKDKTK